MSTNALPSSSIPAHSFISPAVSSSRHAAQTRASFSALSTTDSNLSLQPSTLNGGLFFSTSSSSATLPQQASTSSDEALAPPLRRRANTRRYQDYDPLFQTIPGESAFGVALHPPSPQNAPAVTLSYRSSPHFSSFPTFASLLQSVPKQNVRSASTSSRSSKPPVSSQFTTPANSTPAAFSILEPPDLAASTLTEAISIADEDSTAKTNASAASTPQALTSPAPKKAAWGAPKSWAELAASKKGGVATGAVGISVNYGDVPGSNTASNVGSPSRSPKNSRRKSGDVKRKPAIMSLERLLADAHTQFDAPLTHPRGLVNNGNFCFANTTLQMLVYCAPFYNLFTLIGREVPADFGNFTPLMEAVIHFLREFQVADKVAGVAQDDEDGVSSFAPEASEPFVPEFVYDAMRLNKRFDQMRRGHQEDAEEFLGFFLDTLHEELLSAIRRSAMKLVQSGSGTQSLLTKMSEEEKRLNGITDEDLKRMGIVVGKGSGSAAASDSTGLGLSIDDDEVEAREVARPVSPTEEGWMEVGQKGKTAFTRTTSTSESPITRIFGGKLRSVLKCAGAKDSVTLEPYQPLQLDIQPSHVQSIEDALANLTTPEVIPGVYSPAKGAHIDAIKQVLIESLPPVLILHLKRFVFDEVGGVQKSQKPLAYGTTLEIAGELLSPAIRGQGKQKYRLVGVVYHHGRYASGGHYTVDVLRQDGKSWLHIDDTQFQTIPTEHVVRTAAANTSNQWTAGHDGLAYLLFYRKETEADAAPAPASIPAKVNGNHARTKSTTTTKPVPNGTISSAKEQPAQQQQPKKKTIPGWSK